MEEQIQITIKSGNNLTPYEAYAIKTVDGELAIGYYSDTKKYLKQMTTEIFQLVKYVYMQILRNCRIK